MNDSTLSVNKSIYVGRGFIGHPDDGEKLYFNQGKNGFYRVDKTGHPTGDAAWATTIPKVDVRLYTQYIKDGNIKQDVLTHQPVFCWRKCDSQWQKTALLFTDDSGTIRYVDVDYTYYFEMYKFFLKGHVIDSVTLRNTSVLSKTGYFSEPPLFYRYLRPCIFEPDIEYFFTVLPIMNILRHKDTLIKEKIAWPKRLVRVTVKKVDMMPNRIIRLILDPPESTWHEDAFDMILTDENFKDNVIDFKGAVGTRCPIPFNGNIVIPGNLTYFFNELAGYVSDMEKESASLHSLISHEEKVSNLFDCLINFLIINRGSIGKNNQMNEWQEKIQNYIYFLIHFKNNVQNTYSNIIGDAQKEHVTALYHKSCDHTAGCIERVFLNPEFLGQIERIEKKGLSSIPCMDWYTEHAVSKVICESLSAIGIHSSRDCRLRFYRKFLLPFLLDLSFTLEDNDLKFLQAQVSPLQLKMGMPFLSDEEIESYSAKISEFLGKKSLSDEDKGRLKQTLKILGDGSSTKVLMALFESDQLQVARFFHLVFDTFQDIIDSYDDIEEKIMLSLIQLRASLATVKRAGGITTPSTIKTTSSQKSPGERRYQIRHKDLISNLADTATRVNNNVSGDYDLKRHIGIMSSTLGIVDSILVLGKYRNKKNLTWEDKRDITLASINLTKNSISFICDIVNSGKVNIAEGFLGSASFLFSLMKGQESLEQAWEEENYPAVVLQSYSMASSGLKAAEAMFKTMHRIRCINVGSTLGKEAAEFVFKKGFLFSRFFNAASKFAGPIGLAISVYEIIKLCESYSKEIRRKNNLVWDQTCKFVESINHLISSDVSYGGYTLPELQPEKILGYASIHGGEKPVDWKTFFERTLKTTNVPSYFDCEHFLMQLNRENSRTEMYKIKGVILKELQVNDALALQRNGGIPMETIAEMIGMDKEGLKKTINQYEKQRQAELEEHWRNLKEDYSENDHMKAIADFIED